MPPLNDDEQRGSVALRKRINAWLRKNDDDRGVLAEFAVDYARPQFDGEDPIGTALAHLRRLLDQEKGWTQMNLDRWTVVLDKWDSDQEQQSVKPRVKPRIEEAIVPVPLAEPSDEELLNRELLMLVDRDSLRREYFDLLVELAREHPSPLVLSRLDALSKW